MSSLSLQASLKTCRFDTGSADKIQSDRFFNPKLMICPVWNGMDSTGRFVCPDSFVTKTAGCNSAEDRVMVENDLRPQYAEYINLSAQGYTADIYGGADYSKTMPWNEEGAANADLRRGNALHGSFGQQFKATVYPSCGLNPYREAMAQESYDNRHVQALENGFYANRNRTRSGF